MNVTSAIALRSASVLVIVILALASIHLKAGVRPKLTF
jgi:hypothetical protein